MNTNLRSLREEHEKLIVKAEEDPLPENLISQIDAFMQKVQKAGASVEDSLERDLLRSFLRYWGSYVYKHKGVYPHAELELFTQLKSYPKKRWGVSPALLFVAGALLVLVIVASLAALGYLPMRQTPTSPTPPPPTATPVPAALPRPGRDLIDCRFAAQYPAYPPIIGPELAVDARIVTPKHCTDALPSGTGIDVAGIYMGDLSDSELWVLVYDPEGLFYPQAVDAHAGIFTRAAQGQWHTRVRLGSERPRRGQGAQADEKLPLFHIIVAGASTDSPVSQVFRQWFENGCDTGDFPGFDLEELPEGLTDFDSVTVTTHRVQVADPRASAY